MSEHTVVPVTVWCGEEVETTVHIFCKVRNSSWRPLPQQRENIAIFLTFPSCLQFPPFHSLFPVFILLTSSNSSPTFRSFISSSAVILQYDILLVSALPMS